MINIRKCVYGVCFAAASILLTGCTKNEASVQEHTVAAGIVSSAVESEKTTLDYWLNQSGRTSEIEEIRLTKAEIQTYNQEMLEAPETHMYDLAQMESDYYADAVLQELLEQDFPEEELYRNGERIDATSLSEELRTAIAATGYTGKQRIQYAIITERADVKSWQVADMIGYSASDRDDEFMNTSLNVNEPFLILNQCMIDGMQFF